MGPMLAHAAKKRVCDTQEESGCRGTRIDKRGVVRVVDCEEWAEITCKRDLRARDVGRNDRECSV